MSTITWQGDRLIQRIASKGKEEELGFVRFEPPEKAFILWLKDTRGVFGTSGGYVRGDVFTSMADAKKNAASSVSAHLFNHMWMMADSNDDSLPVSNHEARGIIIETVENMQINQNSLGVQISSADVEKVKAGVGKAEPLLLAKIFREWLPNAFASTGVSALLKMVFGG